ncbi:Hsp90 co-chaperone Cdc37 [Candida viswanathii]|uniref:Hsp90 chaperone protein kinase-targeting subunit n=1 Tax=Candida viswanathii TaxID=5486 RepID=A0A367XWG0_9ASCO|nr:Hsp90 co-chaperone Cdc37 [Candida viswanathii]
MPIDYSKWDHIEISDDSDIEVHPNVDKQSFIRWKQRDIHEKRHQRNIEIKSILIQLTMYAKLNERVDYLTKTLTPEELLDNDKVMSSLNEKFDPNEKFDYEKLVKDKSLRKGLQDLSFDKEEIENTPCYNEMIEDLFIQIEQDHPDSKDSGEKMVDYLKEHRNKIDDVLSKQTIKLDDLLYQKAQLITGDDLHTGFDRSFLNKDKPEDKEEVKEESSILDELVISPTTQKFSEIPSTDYAKSAEFLIKHPSICTEQQKDALMMSAFDLQLENKPAEAKQAVHQALLLQYIANLTGNNPHAPKDNVVNAIKLFFSKIGTDSSPAHQVFWEDVDRTYTHIKGRCEIIKQERELAQYEEGEGEEEAVLQLRALDDKTELLVNMPKEGTQEYEIFTTKVPVEFQKAIETESIDEVNKEFAKLKFEDAEQVLEIIQECGVIGLSGYLENENEFEELKKEYNEEVEQEGKIQEISEDDEEDDAKPSVGIEDTVD